MPKYLWRYWTVALSATGVNLKHSDVEKRVCEWGTLSARVEKWHIRNIYMTLKAVTDKVDCLGWGGLSLRPPTNTFETFSFQMSWWGQSKNSTSLMWACIHESFLSYFLPRHSSSPIYCGKGGKELPSMRDLCSWQWDMMYTLMASPPGWAAVGAHILWLLDGDRCKEHTSCINKKCTKIFGI